MTRSGHKRGQSPEQSSRKGPDHPSSDVLGDTGSVSLCAGSMPHLAHVDDTFSKDLLASPQVNNQEESLSIAASKELLSKEGNADNGEVQANEEEEALAGDNKSKDPNPLIDWSIEGLNELDGSQMHHASAFYTLVKKWYANKQCTSVLMTKMDYDDHVKFLAETAGMLSYTGQWVAGLSSGESTLYFIIL